MLYLNYQNVFLFFNFFLEKIIFGNFEAINNTNNIINFDRCLIAVPKFPVETPKTIIYENNIKKIALNTGSAQIVFLLQKIL